jgi:hypothetical protein
MTEQTLPTELTGAPRYVAYLLNSMSEYIPIEPALERRAVDIMAAISDENTVYPSACTEPDGSLTLYWRGGNRGVELNVGPDDSYYYSVDGKHAEARIVEGEGALPLNDLLAEVHDFSRFVYERNPGWRNFFPSENQ